MNDKKVIIVPEPMSTTIQDFSKIVEPDNFIGDIECPHCKFPVRFPIMVRENDYKMFKRLLEITEEVMTEMGVTEKLLKEVMDKAKMYYHRKIN